MYNFYRLKFTAVICSLGVQSYCSSCCGAPPRTEVLPPRLWEHQPLFMAQSFLRNHTDLRELPRPGDGPWHGCRGTQAWPLIQWRQLCSSSQLQRCPEVGWGLCCECTEVWPLHLPTPASFPPSLPPRRLARALPTSHTSILPQNPFLGEPNLRQLPIFVS